MLLVWSRLLVVLGALIDWDRHPAFAESGDAVFVLVKVFQMGCALWVAHRLFRWGHFGETL